MPLKEVSNRGGRSQFKFLGKTQSQPLKFAAGLDPECALFPLRILSVASVLEKG